MVSTNCSRKRPLGVVSVPELEESRTVVSHSHVKTTLGVVSVPELEESRTVVSHSHVKTTLGVVSVPELEESRTVVSHSHVNECILIAGLMLKDKTLEFWVAVPDRASATFSEQLRQYYDWKFSPAARTSGERTGSER